MWILIDVSQFKPLIYFKQIWSLNWTLSISNRNGEDPYPYFWVSNDACNGITVNISKPVGPTLMWQNPFSLFSFSHQTCLTRLLQHVETSSSRAITPIINYFLLSPQITNIGLSCFILKMHHGHYHLCCHLHVPIIPHLGYLTKINTSRRNLKCTVHFQSLLNVKKKDWQLEGFIPRVLLTWYRWNEHTSSSLLSNLNQKNL